MTQVLYAALAGTATTSDLYTVDPTDGSMISVGPIGDAVTGLAFDPTTGNLYGSTSTQSAANPNSLIAIDISTGAGTLIGAYSQGSRNTAHDIAFDAGGQLWGWGSTGHDLWMIDKTSGAVTSVGALTPDRPGGGIDFDSVGTLWQVVSWSGNINQISTSDGSQTVIEASSDPSNYSHSGKFDGAGLFWCSYPGGTRHGGDSLATVDVSTGVVTIIGTFSVDGVGGLAWGGAATPVLKAKFKGAPLGGYPPLHVVFTDQSTPGPSGPITGWNWDFGDGGGSTLQNPSHDYASAGHYTVTLTVTGTAPDGTDSLIKSSYVLVFGTAALYAALAGSATTSDLYTVDPVTAVMTSVGPTGHAITGMAMDPTDGTLYAATSSNSAAHPKSLITIDPNTGAATYIGNISTGHAAHDIAFDETGQLWGWDSNSGQLWKINKHTGVVTTFGSASGTYGGGLDFDSGGTLWKVGYHIDNCGTVNLTTGAVTFVANTSDGNQLHSGKFDQSGVFWASDPGDSGSAATDLVTVDPSSGVVTEIAPFSVPGVGALAWVATPSTTPDFSASLVPNSIIVSDGIHTLIHLNTIAFHGDTETITLSDTAPSGFTVTFPDNPITAGDINVPIDIAVGSPANGTYTIVIHCIGTDNSHDVNLTVHVVTNVPGFHIAS